MGHHCRNLPKTPPKNGTEPLDHYPTNGRFGTEHLEHRFFGVKNGTDLTVTAKKHGKNGTVSTFGGGRKLEGDRVSA